MHVAAVDFFSELHLFFLLSLFLFAHISSNGTTFSWEKKFELPVVDVVSFHLLIPVCNHLADLCSHLSVCVAYFNWI